MSAKETQTTVAKRLGMAIDLHLRRFEADPKINAARSGTRPYYHANAWGDRHRVRVRYVLYQGDTAISVADATKYLAWLDAGNVGLHYRSIGR